MEELNERVAKLETTVQEHSKLHEKQNDKNDNQTELNTLLKMQIEVNKEQNNQMKEFGLTLNKVNENLTALNISQQQMKDDMSEIGKRVTDIEHNQVEQKIDPIKMFRGIVKQVCLYAGGILVAYIIYKLGISASHNG